LVFRQAIRQGLRSTIVAFNEQGGVVAMLKIYMDESGIHDGSPVVTVGAWFGTPSTWRDFTKDWNQLKRPINVFHAADCANLEGEFKGWHPQDRDAYVAKLLPVIAKHGIGGVLIGIVMKYFEDAMRAVPDLRDMFGTPYDACFQWNVQTFIDFNNQRGGTGRLAFFHETNDYQASANKSFEFVKLNPNNTARGMSLTFGGKDDFVPLQAADVLAYEGNKRLRDVDRPIRRAWTAIDPKANRIRVRYYGKKNMDRLVSSLTRFRAELITSGWDGKIVV
jgi:hypothetical protein